MRALHRPALPRARGRHLVCAPQCTTASMPSRGPGMRLQRHHARLHEGIRGRPVRPRLGMSTPGRHGRAPTLRGACLPYGFAFWHRRHHPDEHDSRLVSVIAFHVTARASRSPSPRVYLLVAHVSVSYVCVSTSPARGAEYARCIDLAPSGTAGGRHLHAPASGSVPSRSYVHYDVDAII